ncbi:MAG: hypothetical protein DCC50_13020, partial [Acidobacteria bacterium]
MGHYKSNVRDTEFMLFDVLERGKILGSAPFEDLDEETARDALRQIATLAEGPIAASFAEADRNPPVFDPATGSVSTIVAPHGLSMSSWASCCCSTVPRRCRTLA